MPLPRIYADFNAIEYPAEEPSVAELPLTGYGTLSSLARQNLRLKEGMRVLIFEPNDIECEATVHFDTSRQDPAGRTGEWVARIEHRSIRSSAEPEEAGMDFPCIVCGSKFESASSVGTRNYQEKCARCGASVMEPLAPPHHAA
jgi:hypothetical protein